LAGTTGADLGATPAYSDTDDVRALRDDARLLLESPLPGEAIRTVWLAVAGGRHDPGTDIRGRLRRIIEKCEEVVSGEPLGTPHDEWLHRSAPPMVVVDEGAMKRAVLRDIRAVSAESAAAPVVSSLGRVVTDVDTDLGFRLFLRVMKAVPVPVALEQYDRYQKIGEGFGYPGCLAHDGLDVRWPRFDDPSHQRRFETDFGFSALAGRFHGDLWQHAYSVGEGMRGPAEDYVGVVQGSCAFALLEDTLRLFRSPLADGTLGDLWRVTTYWGYDLEEKGIEARQWLRRVAGVCAERLQQIDPGFTAGTPRPAATDRTDAVLRELREIAPSLTGAIRGSTGYGMCTSPWFALAAVAVTALEQVITQVDPDLGFRLLLTTVRAYAVPVTEDRYARYLHLGERFGYGRQYVPDMADPSRSY
jgi:hypothetical protein